MLNPYHIDTLLRNYKDNFYATPHSLLSKRESRRLNRRSLTFTKHRARSRSGHKASVEAKKKRRMYRVPPAGIAQAAGERRTVIVAQPKLVASKRGHKRSLSSSSVATDEDVIQAKEPAPKKKQEKRRSRQPNEIREVRFSRMNTQHWIKMLKNFSYLELKMGLERIEQKQSKPLLFDRTKRKCDECGVNIGKRNVRYHSSFTGIDVCYDCARKHTQGEPSRHLFIAVHNAGDPSVNVEYRLADFTKGDTHNGTKCNKCLMAPIVGERFEKVTVDGFETYNLCGNCHAQLPPNFDYANFLRIHRPLSSMQKQKTFTC